MKKIFPLIIMLSLFSFCKEKSEIKAQDVTKEVLLSEFLAMNSKKQAEYINSLSEENKFLFLKEFLPNSCFEIALIGQVFFFPDGEVIFFHEDKEDIEKYTWSIQKDKLVFKLMQRKKKEWSLYQEYPESTYFEWGHLYVKSHYTPHDVSPIFLSFDAVIYHKPGVQLDENSYAGFIYKYHGREKCAGLWLPDDLRKYILKKMTE